MICLNVFVKNVSAQNVHARQVTVGVVIATTRVGATVVVKRS